MSRPKTLRNQHLDAFAEKIFAPIAKHQLRLLVDQNDLSLGIHDDDPVGSRFQQAAELRLRCLGLGAGKVLLLELGMPSFDTGLFWLNRWNPHKGPPGHR